MNHTGVLVSKTLTYEFTYKNEIYTIDETESMMEYDIEVLDNRGQLPSNWDDILEAFQDAREGGLINISFE
jgi:hypothetical protein